MAQTVFDSTAGMQSSTDEERQDVSSGDAVSSPEADGSNTSNTVYLSADPEQTQLLQDILSELQLLNSEVTEQSVLIEAQTAQIVNGNMVQCMILGFIAGALLILGLWLGGRK